MSRARVAVLQIVSKQLSVTAAAAEYGISRRHLHRLLGRYQEGGLDALQPRSRRPLSNSAATPPAIRERVVELRSRLTADGLDAGPVTIAWQLEREGLPAPSTSTIRRILHAAGLITPQPRKLLRRHSLWPGGSGQSCFELHRARRINRCWCRIEHGRRGRRRVYYLIIMRL